MSKRTPASVIARQSAWRYREPAAGGLERFGFASLRGQDVPAVINEIWGEVLTGVQPRQFWHLPEWYEHYTRSLAQEQIHFFIAYYYQRPIGILPLRQRSDVMYGMKVRVLELPTHAHMPLSDLIVDTRFLPPDFFSRFDRFLAREGIAWDVLVLQNVPAESCVLQLLNAAAARYLVNISRRYDCIRANGGYETLARGFASKTRENFRRARRRLSQAGAVEYVTASSGEDLAAAFTAFLEVEASGWKGSDGAGTAIKLDERLLEFYRGIMRAFEPNGGCEINLLKLDGQAIAAQFCLVVDDTVYALKIGYDEAYARFSPGKVLLDEMLRRALAAGRHVNLTSNAPWHADWRPSEETAFKVTVFSCSPRAHLARLLALSDARSRALYRRYIKQPIGSLLAALHRSRRRRPALVSSNVDD